MRIEVDIGKTLRSNGRTFTLSAKFSCDDDLCVIFGPSGAGKSLTLRAIAGLEKPDYGRIVVGGKVLFDSACRHQRACKRAGRRLSIPGLRFISPPERGG
jgi:molybdate transport system ATP-binding protein